MQPTQSNSNSMSKLTANSLRIVLKIVKESKYFHFIKTNYVISISKIRPADSLQFWINAKWLKIE